METDDLGGGAERRPPGPEQPDAPTAPDTPPAPPSIPEPPAPDLPGPERAPRQDPGTPVRIVDPPPDGAPPSIPVETPEQPGEPGLH